MVTTSAVESLNAGKEHKKPRPKPGQRKTFTSRIYDSRNLLYQERLNPQFRRIDGQRKFILFQFQNGTIKSLPKTSAKIVDYFYGQ